MNRILMGIAVGGPMFMSAYALADGEQAGAARHQTMVQIIDCVKKRVASRTATYSEAIKACKEEAGGQAAVSRSEAVLALGVRPKP
jgi:hypothetical protein